MRFTVALAIASFLCAPAYSQIRVGTGFPGGQRGGHDRKHDRPALLDGIERLSPSQRQKMMDRLPPDRAKKLQDQLDRYEQMPPDQREKLREQYDWFLQLPPEKQDAMRKVYRQYSDLPADRREAVRDEFRDLRDLSAPERKSRLKGGELKSRFNKDERKLIEDMAGSVPD